MPGQAESDQAREDQGIYIAGGRIRINNWRTEWEKKVCRYRLKKIYKCVSHATKLALCKSTSAYIKQYRSFKKIIKRIKYNTQLMILYLIMRCCYQLLNIA